MTNTPLVRLELGRQALETPGLGLDRDRFRDLDVASADLATATAALRGALDVGEGYRLVAYAALDRLHELTRAHAQLREAHARAVGELREARQTCATREAIT